MQANEQINDVYIQSSKKHGFCNRRDKNTVVAEVSSMPCSPFFLFVLTFLWALSTFLSFQMQVETVSQSQGPEWKVPLSQMYKHSIKQSLFKEIQCTNKTNKNTVNGI